MADERYNFAQARARLEEIVAQVRKKDTSLEKSLDLLEEGVRLANTCTELSDHTEWRTVAEEQADAGDETSDAGSDLADEAGGASGPDDAAAAPKTDEPPDPVEEALPAE
jgi:exodeoxyribonuclease VII small subunit